jgi:diguanylate cyclase (GGDEF)-like protein
VAEHGVRNPRENWLSVGYLAVAAAATAEFAYPGFPHPVRDHVNTALGASLVVAILVGVRRYQPHARRAWHRMALAQTLWVIADTTFHLQQHVLHRDTFPTISDAFFLLGYPVFAAGLLELARERSRTRPDRGPALDAATVTIALGLLSWTVLARPVLSTFDQAPWAALVGTAYPAMDVVLIGALVRLLCSPGGRSPAFAYLSGALALLITADTLSVGFDLFATNAVTFTEPLWLASYCAWGAAALHPSMSKLSDPVSTADPGFHGVRLGSVVGAVLIGPGILAVHQATGVSIDAWAVILGSVTMFLLVVFRMNLAISQIGSVNRSLEVLQDELNVQATRDPLTGLANRSQTMRLAAGALGRSRRRTTMVGLLFIDLDGFKQVNDTYGHRAGDEVLREVARRMEQIVRDGDFVGRLGGDEFVVGIENLVDEQAAVGLADRLIVAISKEIHIDEGIAVHVGASIGIAIGSAETPDIESLVHEADLAVYQAKEAGRGRVELFNGQTREAIRERADLERALIHAMAEDELVLHYQPIVHLETGQAECYEALVRWNRPGHGLVPPGDFLPVMENTDLICDLGAWVLHAAVEQLEIWNLQRGDYAMQVSVNVSGRHISQARVLDDVAAALRGGLVLPPQLVVEVTETAPLDDVAATSNLETLREMGVVVSLDDFGTGYQSSSRLSRLPVDSIKIDRQFVQSSTESDHSLLALMIKAGEAFGVRVIVEGVERPDQLALVRSLGCEYVQGFYLGRPVPAPDLDAPGPGRMLAG